MDDSVTILSGDCATSCIISPSLRLLRRLSSEPSRGIRPFLFFLLFCQGNTPGVEIGETLLNSLSTIISPPPPSGTGSLVAAVNAATTASDKRETAALPPAALAAVAVAFTTAAQAAATGCEVAATAAEAASFRCVAVARRAVAATCCGCEGGADLCAAALTCDGMIKCASGGILSKTTSPASSSSWMVASAVARGNGGGHTSWDVDGATPATFWLPAKGSVPADIASSAAGFCAMSCAFRP